MPMFAPRRALFTVVVRTVAVLTASLAAASASAATLDNSDITARTTRVTLSFSDLSFDNLTGTTSTVAQFSGNVGDSGTFTETGLTPGSYISLASGSGMTVTGGGPADANGDATFTVTITGTTNQFITMDVPLVVGTPGAGHSLTLDDTGALSTVDFNAHSHGLLATGGSFTYFMTLPGNWSNQGTSTGELDYLGIAAGFNVIQNFTYNAGSNTTTFEAYDSSYAAGAPNVGLAFNLVGAATPVPEPSQAALLLLGVAGLATRRLRARHRTAKR